MKKMSKEMELSCKALGAAIFMGIVCLYMAIGALLGGDHFHYHVSFAFLMQGIAVSMLSSAMWVLCFGSANLWRFFTRYLLILVILAVLFAMSMLIPAINAIEGHFIWIISGIISTLAFGTAVAVLSNKRFKKTGTRSTLLWEIS